MNELILKFPKTLEAHFWNNDHQRLWMILGILAMLFVPMIIFLSQLPPREITQAEREEYLRVIYRAPAVDKMVEKVPVETVEEGEVVTGRKTIEERRAESQQRVEERVARKEERLEQIRSTGIFTAAGAQMPTFEISNGKALSLTGGSLQGLIAKSMKEIATRPDEEILEEFKDEGLIRDVELDLAITKLEIPEFENEGVEASIQLESIPQIRSKAAPSEARNPEKIKEFIDYRIPGLQSCYLTQKNKDKTLKGSLLVKCILQPDGTVSSVRFRNSRWSNPALGRRVERCLKQKILLWKFDPADEEKEIPVDFPLVFS